MCGRIIGDQRNNLNAETLEMLTCIQDWFAAEKKIVRLERLMNLQAQVLRNMKNIRTIF
ncbi:zinc finger BED domain-containing protein RICESLEEPER 1-like [Dorcoceras hygrometricum]|uniref:Zinc finger BED domain-containing protein RICESLEEPER 1-like n=1 Tax=Dorcoceras hygrometricum TaxID=472368 RepID=A0A2Z7CK59_9LAMI|nr:zinc finger BED domain-containing protein RICESLEEPER 1-like [Dorcoceras hygrometricum]